MTTNWTPTAQDHHITGALVPAAPRAVTPTFRWCDRHGVFHDVANMETRHLFFTLRMIWNNTMPAAFRLPGNLYHFGEFYSRKYMHEAIAAITKELATRTDMAPDWSRQLQQMIDWLAAPHLPAFSKELLR